jgi:ribosomal protein S21
MVEVKRKENEPVGSLIRRFTRKVQQSGVLLNARKIRFFERHKSKLRVRREAQMRKEITAIKEKLRKLGKDEENFDIRDKRLFKHMLKQK